MNSIQRAAAGATRAADSEMNTGITAAHLQEMANRPEPTHVSLPIEAIAALRRTLLIGLHCLGEVERLSDTANTFEKLGAPWQEDHIPVHPSGSYEITNFANALRWLENAEEIDA